MDGECCLKLNSNILAKKLCGTRVDDRISELPDEIILVIMSFLLLRKAVTTSVLSSRWSDLWKHTPYLFFNSNNLKLINGTSVEGSAWDVERCKYVQLVNSVIQSHKVLSLKKFGISFYVDKSAKSAVTKWLEFVFSRQVESLHLDFKCEAILNMAVLEELLRESRISVVLFKSLKRLYLKCLKVSGEDIKLFLRNSPLLERLVIHKANLVSDVEVCGTTHDQLTLKRLDIRWCNGVKSIKVVSAPNLTWIRVDESSGKLSIENVPKLVEVCFRIKSREYVAQQFASAVSCCISQLRYLTLNLLHPKEFLANEHFPIMPKLKKLVVEDFGVHKQRGFLPITALIMASPRLQYFILKFFGDLKDAPSQMEVVKNVKRYRHQHLEKIEFQGSCRGVSDHIVELVTYLSANCVALRKIIIGRPLWATSEIGAEVQARDYLKQQLQGKLHNNAEMQFLQL